MLKIDEMGRLVCFCDNTLMSGVVFETAMRKFASNVCREPYPCSFFII